VTGAAEAGPRPTPLPDAGVGPAVVVGEPVSLSPVVVRLTAPNPGRMTGPGTNTYLIGRREVAVIDPGPVIEEHLDAIESAASARGATVRWVVVTHHHPDHAPAAPVLAGRTGAEFLAFGHEEGVDPDRAVGEGFVLDGPGFALRALHTPGHASDHLCWLLESERLLFSGDHVMHGSTVVIRPPDADMTAYLESLARLAALEPPIARIAPGHGRLIGDPAGLIAAIVGHRLDREARVAAALASVGRGTVDELLGSVYEDVAESMLDVARFSLWAHLQKLALDGRATLLDAGEDDPRRSTESSLWGSVASVRTPARR